MDRSYEILVSIDALDAVVSYTFPKADRQQIGNGRIVYTLPNTAGKIELRTITEASTWLELQEPKTPFWRKFNPDELAQIRANVNRLDEIETSRERDRQQQYKQHLDAFDRAVSWLEYRINSQLGHVLQPTTEPTPPASEVPPKKRKLKRVLERQTEIKKLFIEGLTQQEISDRTGFPIRTIREDGKELGLVWR